MNWASIKETIASVAPLAGTLIGGPVGGTVGSLISSALGVKNEPAAVATALLDPNKQIDLQKWEMAHTEKLTAMALEQTKVELLDIQNARFAHKHSKMPAIITVGMTVMAAVYGAGIFFVEIADSNRDMVNYFGGQLVTLWVASVVYWVGTTRSSSEKNKWISSNK